MNNEGHKGFIIAIDGPVASGKGTIAPLLAERLHGFYMNTGGLFRMLALYAYKNNISLEEESLLAIYPSLTLDLENSKNLLNGEDVSGEIYGSDISQGSSIVASLPKVHEQVVFREREIGYAHAETGGIVIAEGRNTATAVFPDAAFKVFMTADLTTRARRRYDQAITRGEDVRLEAVVQDTQARDLRDRSRSFYPMVERPEDHGYYVLDNSLLTEEDTLNRLVVELQERELIDD